MSEFLLIKLIKKLCLGISISLILAYLFFQSSFLNHGWIYPNSVQTYTSALKEEQFNEDLEFLDSLKKLKKYFLEKINENKLNEMDSVIFADKLLRERFYHQNTNVQLKDNWFLYVFNFFSSNHNNSSYLSSLSPDYILRFNGAICNQQALIFQALMEEIEIEYQSVLFNISNSSDSFGHFSSAVMVDGNWLFVDTNLEPQYDLKDFTILKRLLNSDTSLFNSMYPENAVQEIPKGSIWLSSKNKNPAIRGRIFQEICYFISYYAWILFFTTYLMLRSISRE